MKKSFPTQLKRFLNARVLLTFGLVSLVISALLGALWLGVMPDRGAYHRLSRATMAETVAVSVMLPMNETQDAQAQAILDFVLQRNSELDSLGVRNQQQDLLLAAGPHAQKWAAREDGKSTENQLIVPLSNKEGRWGQVELNFKPIPDNQIFFWYGDERIQLLLIIAVMCSCSFYLYLGRMLKQLDPSRAVPDRVRSALDTLSESVLLLDTEGNIVLANSALASLVGVPREKLIGAKADQLPWLRENSQLAYPWRSVLDGKGSQLNVPMAMNDASGKKRSFQCNCAPVTAGNDKVGGVLISLADITELQEKEAQLVESKAHAEQANRAKSDFLANMSHEIRTPMNAVLGFTDLLRRGVYQSPEQAQKYLNTVHSSGKHLLGLINDILDLSKVESGKLVIERLPTSVAQVVAEVADVMKVKAQEKGITLSLELEGAIPETVDIDAGKVRQIVTNLVGNAIKFTEQGSVRIVQHWNPNTKMMGVDIIDSGIGIPADKVNAIFQPFTQAESSTTRRFGGTGLGLSISQKFARAMGGDIQVRSSYGQGSCFAVSMHTPQFSQQMITSLKEIEARASQSAGASMNVKYESGRILVVDDSLENRELLKAVLIPAGLEVDEAENGFVAVNMAKAKRYGVILMDMQMPVMDGFTATRTLRDAGSTVPIIAFTAHALKGFEVEIAAAGCTGYMTKPVDIDLLHRTLSSYFEVSGEQEVQANFASQSESATATAESSLMQGPVISRLAQSPALHNVINIFVQRMPKQLELIQQSLKTEDFDQLASLAHWLKGSAGSVGFDGYTQPSKHLEKAALAQDVAQAMLHLREIESLTGRLQPAGEKAAMPAMI
jgi:PAS domain S-box-containing protein